jgi:hypothetical protein
MFSFHLSPPFVAWCSEQIISFRIQVKPARPSFAAKKRMGLSLKIFGECEKARHREHVDEQQRRCFDAFESTRLQMPRSY